MNKTLIIIQREYLTRVRKKSFIIMTLLTPLLMIALIGTPVWLESMNQRSTLANKSETKEIELLLQEAGIEVKETIQWSENSEEKEKFAESALIIGMATAVLIYFFILIYGAQVMRGVVEEKANRIVEIIISSVKPFELMIGKIVGIALVGLTQFLIWAVLIVVLLVVFNVNAFSVDSMIPAFSSFNFAAILFFFIIYFLGGYLLYASLFAAIWAASDNETDTQQFMLPVILPVLFALFAAIHGANNPDGSLAFWTSLVPFTSPIVMMVRIPAGVPVWELIVSVLLLLLSFIGTTWMAAKIYRTGILMYGKKVNYREIWKWMRYK